MAPRRPPHEGNGPRDNKTKETSVAAYAWIKSYPGGVRWDAELPTMPLQQLLDDAVAHWADRPALATATHR